MRWEKLKERALGLFLAVVFILGACGGPAWAREPATPELSLNDAIALALAQSEKVKKAEKEIERTEALREHAADQLDYVPVMPAGNPAVEAAWANLLAADLTWRMSKKSLTAEQDTVALDACKKYWDVLLAKAKVDAAEKALASAEKTLQRVRALYNAGMATLAELAGAEAQYRAAEAAAEKARNDLTNAYLALNQLLGFWPEDRPVLTTPLELHPLDVADLDYEVTKVLENCPKVWLARETVNLKKYLEDVMFYTGIATGTFSYKPYEARKVEVEQAELDAASTEKLFALITRQLYYGAKSLEEAYAGAEEAVKARAEALRVARLKREAGVSVPAEVAEAERALAEAQSKVSEIVAQHSYLKLAFEKPWAYLSLLSSSSSSRSE